jgi:hypothetical protein
MKFEQNWNVIRSVEKVLCGSDESEQDIEAKERELRRRPRPA